MNSIKRLPHENDVMPIVIGWHYNLTPNEASSNWITVVDIRRGYVYVKGLDNTIAEWSVPKWKFDDLIKEYRPM